MTVIKRQGLQGLGKGRRQALAEGHGGCSSGGKHLNGCAIKSESEVEWD